MVVYSGVRCCTIVFSVDQWCTVMYVGVWWCIVVFCGVLWYIFRMVNGAIFFFFDGLEWCTAVYYDLQLSKVVHGSLQCLLHPIFTFVLVFWMSGAFSTAGGVGRGSLGRVNEDDMRSWWKWMKEYSCLQKMFSVFSIANLFSLPITTSISESKSPSPRKRLYVLCPSGTT